jgi:hypothetical protein
VLSGNPSKVRSAGQQVSWFNPAPQHSRSGTVSWGWYTIISIKWLANDLEDLVRCVDEHEDVEEDGEDEHEA